MLNLQIASDLHIEYKNNDIPDPLDYITPQAEILVLAGDIGSLYKINQLEGFLKKVCEYFKTVIYVPGNQEFYIVPEIEPVSMNQLTIRLYEIENNIENLYILNQSSLIIDDICITGCTLWSDLKIKIPKFIVRIHGIHNIIYEKKFENDVKYIKKMINYSQANNLKFVAITHYCPTYKVLKDSNKRDKYVSLYTSELDYLLTNDQVHTWICGHIHKNFDFNTENGTRIVGNQLGKPKDNIKDYSKNFIVKI
jgi:predicted phosphodiesterase